MTRRDFVKYLSTFLLFIKKYAASSAKMKRRGRERERMGQNDAAANTVISHDSGALHDKGNRIFKTKTQKLSAPPPLVYVPFAVP